MAEEKGTEVRHEWVGVCCTATQKPGAGQPRTVSFNLFPSLCEKAAEAVPSIPHSCLLPAVTPAPSFPEPWSYSK